MSKNNTYLSFASSHSTEQIAVLNAIFRAKFITGAIVLVFCIIALRLFDLSLISPHDISSMYKKEIQRLNVISRADIVDRNNILLASNIKTASLYAHPKQLIDSSKVAKQLAALNIGLDEDVLLKKLKSKKDFIWIKRHIVPNEQQKIHDLGIPGLYFTKDEKRLYPHENLFSHILGYVDIDGHGIAGIEKLYNNRLIQAESESTPLMLSMDVRIQNILHSEIKNAINMHSAEGGSGIVMNVNTGEILAMASLPDFNPHRLSEARQDSFFNQPTLGVYEMGSIFKMFTIAMALDSNKVSINDAFDVSAPLKVGRFTIHDYKGKGGILSIPEIFTYSSNLGTANIAKKIGIQDQKEYFRRLGFLSEVSAEVPEKMRPLYPIDKKWSEASLITISYGHGMAVTAIHVAQAVSAVVNGGILYKPTLLKHQDTDQLSYKRVFKTKTSNTMRKLLRLSTEKGTSKKADIEGLLVGGKTGTAEVNKDGKYNKKLNVAIFAGAFPMNDPQYMVLVMIDKAKPNSINGGYTTGGMIAAPLGGQIIKRMSQVLDIMTQDHNDPEILQAMYLDYTPRHVTKVAKR